MRARIFRPLVLPAAAAVLWMAFPLTAVSTLAQEAATAQPTTILTPAPAPKPRINGAKVFGVRPGNPCLFTIPATGKRPMTFAAEGLPPGLVLDEKTGRISGSTRAEGTHRVVLRATNALAVAQRELRIVVGDEIALTPPMGCNTWGGWGPLVNEKNIRAAAEAMVDSGLAGHGYAYINIDDGWQGKRGGEYNAIQPNDKFGDMKALCDYVHARGLKIGIYSTPWITSYSGFVGGSSDHEDGSWRLAERKTDQWRHGKFCFDENDVRQWAEWGFDYAKYDWRIDDTGIAKRMADALGSSGRDMVYNLSNSAPLDQAAEYTGLVNMCRTTGDLVDVWDRSQLDERIRRWALGVRDLWVLHEKWQPFSRPGHWNNPCPLRVGQLGGWANRPLRPSRLTPDEQYTHVSLWCLWSSPLIIGCPVERLDKFTLSLLTNDEVLEINQDPLGRQAGPVAKDAEHEVLAKDLEDGSQAVGLFNLTRAEREVAIRWTDLAIRGKQRVRDLWRQQDLGLHEQRFAAQVSGHGVVLVKITPEPGPK